MKDKNYISNLPIPSVGGISLYLAQIKKFPMLDAEEEYMLAKNGKNIEIYNLPQMNYQSFKKLKNSYGYRGYDTS